MGREHVGAAAKALQDAQGGNRSSRVLLILHQGLVAVFVSGVFLGLGVLGVDEGFANVAQFRLRKSRSSATGGGSALPGSRGVLG